MRTHSSFAAFILPMMLLPAFASGQTLTSGSIAGVVKDATGAVLPGVTVEAASPALIEKVRTVVTDGQGRYTIVELRPGDYTVTFSLAGFATVKREGIALTTAFTAAVDADLRVGSVQETVVVSGASPLVDVQNVRAANILSQAQLDTLPTAKSFPGYGAMIVGAVVAPTAQDVGGNRGESVAAMSVHGSRPLDTKLLMEGMRFNQALGVGGGTLRFFNINQAFVEEIALETGGMSAESETAGVQMNAVPKDGGNTFHGYLFGNGTGSSLQGSNLNDKLRARGLTNTPTVRKIYDVAGSLGGPVKRDKLWIFTAHRWWGASEYAPGNYFDKTPGDLFYVADLTRPAYTDWPSQDNSVRVTWQAAAKHKLTFSESRQDNRYLYLSANTNRAPEATSHATFTPVHLAQASWNFPTTSRLLVQAGLTYGYNPHYELRPSEQTANAIPITDVSTGFLYNSKAGLGFNDYTDANETANQINGRASVSYVTGTHALKAGVFFYRGENNTLVTLNDPPVSYSFRNCFTIGCEPVSVTYWASPHRADARVVNSAVYGQDQWTLRQVTLNLGVRLDYLHAWNPAQHRPAGPFVAAFDFPKVDNVPNWKDLSPRLGIAYNMFGDGRTAIKAYLGKYVVGEATTIALATNPANAIVTNASRNWNDANHDFVPQENELAGLSNNLFGTVQVNRRYADELINGFGVRNYTWQGSLSVQHELQRGIGVSVGYFRTSYGKFTVTDSLNVTPADYDPYCVSAPTDARLPGSGAFAICGLYDVNQSAFGRAAAGFLVRPASDFGKHTEVYDGFDLVVRGRFGRGGMVTGGVNTGRTVIDDCAVVDSPQLQFCRNTLPFKGQTQFKVSGAYPLPWGLQASAVFQNLPGVPVLATRAFPNSEIASSLGRNLSSCPSATGACTATASVVLIEPNTAFEDRLTQVDVRLSKLFQIRRVRLQGMLDVYNLLNANTILARNNTFGSTWGRPNQILAPRLFKLGARLDF